MKYLPPLYESKARDWGCCRECRDKEPKKRFKRAKKEVRVRDFSRFVNCCPFCPWPPKRTTSKLGPYLHYYMKKETQQGDLYEKELEGFARPDRGQPAPTAAQLEAARQATGEGQHMENVATNEAQAEADTGGTFVEEAESRRRRRVHAQKKQQGRLQASEESSESGAAAMKFDQSQYFVPRDPYMVMRGFNMDRSQNYVYGFPGSEQLVGAIPDPDLPPCCTICTRSHETLQVSGDTGCCVHCASSLMGDAPWRTRRERIEAEEESSEESSGSSEAESSEASAESAASAECPPLISYRVKKGDWLSKIAKRYKTTVKEIAGLNPQIKDVDLIYPHQVFKIPNPDCKPEA